MYQRKVKGAAAAILTGSLIAVMMLTGCNKNKTDNAAEDTPKEVSSVQETEKSDAMTEEMNISESDDETTESMDETAEASQELAEENITPDETEDLTEDAVNSGIVNNNGHFVQIGDKIYFHIADADSMGRTALWGQYADSERGRTVLMEYDLKTNEVEPVAYDYIRGGISVQGGSLYSSAYSEQFENPGCLDPVMGVYSLEGETKQINYTYDDEVMLGSAGDDTYIVTSHYNYVNQFLLYRDGILEKIFDTSDSYSVCVKLTENDIYYFYGDSGSGYMLAQLNIETGDSIDLGMLPAFEETEWYGYVDECIMDDENIYFTYSDYEGTGHFFTQGYFVQAGIGVADSLTYENMPTDVNSEDPVVSKFAVDKGRMIVAEGEPGTCEVKINGDLGYFDDLGKWNYVAGGWENIYSPEGEGEDYKGVELAEKLGDYIYLIYNDNARAPEEDIGWRYAYYRNSIDVYRVSVETGESVNIIHQVAPWGD